MLRRLTPSASTLYCALPALLLRRAPDRVSYICAVGPARRQNFFSTLPEIAEPPCELLRRCTAATPSPMPKEKIKRGRREEKKKRKHDADDSHAASKRLKPDESAPAHQEEAFHYEATDDVTQGPAALTFYGMLDEEEQEYFKRADEMLELNQFEDPEARNLFLESVYKEADGKELKIANSQSCSRLLERLILLSTPDQLKNLFQKFNGQSV